MMARIAIVTQRTVQSTVRVSRIDRMQPEAAV